jgi:iron complex transport system permease protein
MKTRHSYYLLLAIFLVLLVSVFISAALGSAGFIGPVQVVRALGGVFGFTDPAVPLEETAVVLLQLRLPRIALGILAGTNLALAGLIMQTLFHNSLADPYIIGVSSGAALGAVTAISLGLHLASFGLNAVSLSAFIGALSLTLVVYIIARRENSVPQSMLLLTGISVGALAQAITTLLLLRSEGNQLRSTMAWLLGSLAYRDWSYIQTLLPYTILGALASMYFCRPLNLLAMGDEAAHHLGIRLEPTRMALLIVSSLLAASAVAACGIVGFVGLLVPNLMRLLVGPNHRILIPASILGGALLLTWADTVARILFPGQEIPIGVVTSVLGGLFFIYLLKRQANRQWHV